MNTVTKPVRAAPARPSLAKGGNEPPLERPLPGLADDYIALLVASLAMRLSRGASNFYTRHWGIGSTEYRTVMALGRDGPCSAVHVAASADVDKAAISRSLQTLAAAGMVDLDRRGREVECSLTEAGKSLHLALRKSSKRRDARLTRGMSADEIAALRVTLSRLIDNIAYMNED